MIKGGERVVRVFSTSSTPFLCWNYSTHVYHVMPRGSNFQSEVKVYNNTDRPWSPFLEVPDQLFHPKIPSKISSHKMSKLFYAQIHNVNRDSIHTISLRHIHLSIINTDKLKMALRTGEVSGAFEKLTHEPVNDLFLYSSLLSLYHKVMVGHL